MKMVDRAYPPTLAELNRLHDDNVAALALYVGGENDGGRDWHPDHAAQMRREFKYVLPIYVGENACPNCTSEELTAAEGAVDGADAVLCAQAYGFPTGPLCLDVEYETYMGDIAHALQYEESWSKVVRNAGYRPVLYTANRTPEDYNPRSGEPVGMWIANWDGVGDLTKFPNAARFHGIGWQYSDNNGMGFDVSNVDGNWWTTPGQAPQATPTENPDHDLVTDKYIDPAFSQFFHTNGGIAIFGRPVTGSFNDGDGMLVQFFERNVFELHPEGVLLQRLGAAAAAAAGFSGPGIP